MRESTLKIVQDQQLTSVMNNTRWKKLIAGLNSDPDFNPSVYIEYLFKKMNGTGFTPVWWDLVENDGFEIIEWLDILPYKEIQTGKLVPNKRIDYSCFIRSVLDSNLIYYEMKEEIFRVFGYRR